MVRKRLCAPITMTNRHGHYRVSGYGREKNDGREKKEYGWEKNESDKDK